MVTAAGFSFDTEPGRYYQITCTLTAEQKISSSGYLYILTGGELTGSFNSDRIREHYYNLEHSDKYEFSFRILGNGDVLRILLFNYQQYELGYSITIEKFKSYADLDYSQQITVDGGAVTGSLSEQVMISTGGGLMVTAAGYSFDTEPGRYYQITCTLTAEHGVWSNCNLSILTGGKLTGSYFNDRIDGTSILIFEKENKILFHILANGDMLRILLYDYGQNELYYSVAIEEAKSYVDLDYSQQVIVDGATVTGSLSELVIVDRNLQATAAGFSFDAEPGRFYQITCMLTSENDVDVNIALNTLTGYDLTGSYYLDRIAVAGVGDYGKNFTVTLYAATTGNSMRILLLDSQMNELNYSITIKASNVRAYTDAEMYRLVTVGDPFEGSLSDAEMTITKWDGIHPASGYCFDAEPGRYYQITCTLTAEQEVYMRGILGILTGDELQGTDNDWISGRDFMLYSKEYEFSFRVRADWDVVRILLYDIEHNGLDYSITIIKELESYPVTFNVVGGNGNLSATINGTTVTSHSIVKEGEKIVFHASPNSGYRVKEWTLNGTVITDNTTNTYTLSNISASATLTVMFDLVTSTSSPEVSPDNPLRAWMQAGLLRITGLTIGETVSIYSATGALVHHGVATSDETYIVLKTQGVYIVKSGNNTVKVAL